MNVLKPNNRFSSLLEDNRPFHTRHVGVSRYNKYTPDTNNGTKSNKPEHPNINMSDFPVLIATGANTNVGDLGDVKHNYVTKVLHQPNIDPEKGEVLPYGWIVLTPNKYNNNVNNVKPTIKPSWENAMDSLVKLYNKRKDEYISLWGKETYENIFLFPNYDYDYYDYDDDDDEGEDCDDDDEYEYEEYYN